MKILASLVNKKVYDFDLVFFDHLSVELNVERKEIENQIWKNAQIIQELLLQMEETPLIERKLSVLNQINEYSMKERLEILELIVHDDEMLFEGWFISNFNFQGKPIS